MNSRAKGKRGELELAKVLRLYGYDAHRGQQYKGGADSPDVKGIPGYKILDTHVGSGSSLIACKRKGFEAWGFEINPQYYAAAVERIERETAQGTLF